MPSCNRLDRILFGSETEFRHIAQQAHISKHVLSSDDQPVHVDRKVTVEVEVTKMVEKMKKTFYELEFRGYVENPTHTDLCIKGTAQVLKRDAC